MPWPGGGDAVNPISHFKPRRGAEGFDAAPRRSGDNHTPMVPITAFKIYRVHVYRGSLDLLAYEVKAY